MFFFARALSLLLFLFLKRVATQSVELELLWMGVQILEAPSRRVRFLLQVIFWVNPVLLIRSDLDLIILLFVLEDHFHRRGGIVFDVPAKSLTPVRVLNYRSCRSISQRD